MNKDTGDAVVARFYLEGVPLMTDVNTISAEDFQRLLTVHGSEIMTADRRHCLHFCYIGNEFVMMGPTGVHSLYAGATDRKRLNAHWLVFSAN